VNIARFVIASSALSLSAAACGASPDDAAATSEAIVSYEKTFLVSTDERARVACRAEIDAYYCTAADAIAAEQRCAARVGARAASIVRGERVTEACAGDAPIYPSAATCLAPRPRSCAFYAACVDRETPCGESGYALGYGERYCTAFKNVTTFTPKGAAWRDSVMLCLQEELVPFTQPGSAATCDTILETAFDSHPRCYTKPEHSICFLPPSDIFAIVSTIGGTELLTARSRKQILTTITTCIGQIGGRLFGAFGGEADALREQDAVWRELERTWRE